MNLDFLIMVYFDAFFFQNWRFEGKNNNIFDAYDLIINFESFGRKSCFESFWKRHIKMRSVFTKIQTDYVRFIKA